MFGKQKWNEGDALRRQAINELNFTYKRLLRLLPALVRRTHEPRLISVLKDQHDLDIDSARRFEKFAVDMGQPPSPALCEEADRLLDDVYHADRAGGAPEARIDRMVRALRVVRIHLVRTWGRLLGVLGDDSDATLREEAVAVQNNDAAQHLQLVEFTNQVGTKTDRGIDGARERRTG